MLAWGKGREKVWREADVLRGGNPAVCVYVSLQYSIIMRVELNQWKLALKGKDKFPSFTTTTPIIIITPRTVSRSAQN